MANKLDYEADGFIKRPDLFTSSSEIDFKPKAITSL
jgi:hypothetical protein